MKQEQQKNQQKNQANSITKYRHYQDIIVGDVGEIIKYINQQGGGSSGTDITQYLYSFGEYAGRKLGNMYFGWTRKNYDATTKQWTSLARESNEFPRYPVYTFAPSLDWQDIDIMHRNDELSTQMLYTYWITGSTLLTFILDSQTDDFIQLWNTTNLKENDIISKVEVPGNSDYTEGEGYNLRVTTHSNNESVVKLPIPKYELVVTFGFFTIQGETNLPGTGIYTITFPAFSANDKLAGNNDQEYYLELSNKLSSLGKTNFNNQYPILGNSPLAISGVISIASGIYTDNGVLQLELHGLRNGIGGTAGSYAGNNTVSISLNHFRMLTQWVKER